MPEDTKTIEIKLFLLERDGTPMPDEWGQCIVAASTEKAARELANQESGAEGYVWTDGRSTNARFLGVAVDGVEGVLIISRDLK